MKRSILAILLGVVILSLIVAGFVAPRLAADSKGKKSNKSEIAVVYIEGAIMGGRGASGFMSEGAGADFIMRQLREIREETKVKAVVLRINSPGGTVAASQEIGREIKRVREAGKIVVVSMGDVAASGGYWLAAHADKIVANPGTTTGSIGVILPLSNWEELYKKIGIQPNPIKSGAHKDIGSTSRPMTQEERNILQGLVNDMYNQFVAVVAEGRKMDEAKVRELADGRIFSGAQAKELGLVDELGNFYDAIQIASDLAGIQGKPSVKEFGKPSPIEYLLGETREQLSSAMAKGITSAIRSELEQPGIPEGR